MKSNRYDDGDKDRKRPYNTEQHKATIGKLREASKTSYKHIYTTNRDI